MDGSIVLVGGQRKRLLELYPKEPDPAVRLRAHLILLLADGYASSSIAAVLFCSTATIARLEAAVRERGGRRCCWRRSAGVRSRPPARCGSGRRWSCAGR